VIVGGRYVGSLDGVDTMSKETVSILALIFFGVFTGSASAKTLSEAQINSMLNNLDSLYRSDSSKGVMSMKVVTAHYTRTLKMEMVTRGQDDTLIRIVSPRKEKGVSTLKRGNEMWNYLPKIKKVIRIPASMMGGSWMGSDLTNDDLVRGSSYKNDYTTQHVPARPGEICLLHTPKENAAITWSKVHSCFDAGNQLPKRMEFYDEKDRKVRLLEYDEVKSLGGRLLPTRMTLTPLSEDNLGNKTVMSFEEMQFNVDVNATTFSEANLRRGR
jgi:outer membrane lipoprotein-sorting protein